MSRKRYTGCNLSTNHATSPKTLGYEAQTYTKAQSLIIYRVGLCLLRHWLPKPGLGQGHNRHVNFKKKKIQPSSYRIDPSLFTPWPHQSHFVFLKMLYIFLGEQYTPWAFCFVLNELIHYGLHNTNTNSIVIAIRLMSAVTLK